MVKWYTCEFFPFFQLEFVPCNAEQPLQGMELERRKEQKKKERKKQNKKEEKQSHFNLLIIKD